MRGRSGGRSEKEGRAGYGCQSYRSFPYTRGSSGSRREHFMPQSLVRKMFWEQWLVPGSHDFVTNVSISVDTGKEGVVMRVGKFSNIGCVSWRWQTVDLFISAVAGRILATTRKLRFISFARYVSYKCKDFWMEISSGNWKSNIGPRESSNALSHSSSRTVRFIGFSEA